QASDSAAVGTTAGAAVAEAPPATPLPVVAPAPPSTDEPLASDSVFPSRRVVVSNSLYRLTFESRGARLIEAELSSYRSFAPNDSGRAHVIPDDSEFMTYGLVVGGDTVNLADWEFTPSDTLIEVATGRRSLNWEAQRGRVTVSLSYSFASDDYLIDVTGTIAGLGSDNAMVLVSLGPRLATTERDTVGDFRSYNVVMHAHSTDHLKFSSLDPGERRQIPGPFEWIAIKSKYFFTALLAGEDGMPLFGGVEVVGGQQSGRAMSHVHVRASLPAPGGRFAHSAYIGPQEFRRLAAVGNDFEEVNPYGWFLRPVVSPFAKIIVRILVWMHENMNLAYGWVLVVFGVAVRALLWPLNQKSMRSSVAMQAIQPEMKAIQDRLRQASSPQQKQAIQREMMQLYREHGVNPLGGCLPALLPMPILFALFFVFQNTIELRGVPFLWLPDLSLPDPLFITPVVMAASMYFLFKIGQRGAPPNPQTKMMLYVMPAMFLVFGMKFPSGLNVYYAVSNLVSLPQQWLIARERAKRQGAKANT
ncbi:MAG: membrane protein insertase YidC, partial [Gemmatimonadales bacterium]